MLGKKVSRFERFKQRVMGTRDVVPKQEAEQHIGMSVATLEELLGKIGFSEPVPFLIVELECPPEMLKEWESARVELSTVGQGADIILAVFRNDKFALVPASI